MSNAEQAAMMLEKAENDARACRAMYDSETFPDDIFGFHAQQAVEKGLKAWLSAVGVPYPRVHDLEVLIDLLGNADQHDAAAFRDLLYLTEYAVQFRYQPAFELDEELNRAEINRRIRELLERVKEAVSAS